MLQAWETYSDSQLEAHRDWDDVRFWDDDGSLITFGGAGGREGSITFPEGAHNLPRTFSESPEGYEPPGAAGALLSPHSDASGTCDLTSNASGGGTCPPEPPSSGGVGVDGQTARAESDGGPSRRPGIHSLLHNAYSARATSYNSARGTGVPRS